MNLNIITIVLDGMPFIACHLPVFNRLSFNWTWHVVEGVAANTHCTSWCKSIPGRLSNDGTTQYLDSIASHPNVVLYRANRFDGKIEMVNAPCQSIQEECLLMQIDSDELWLADQIEFLRFMMMARPGCSSAMFRCRYYVGPNIVIQSDNTYGNRLDYEWRRAWRFKPGMKFEKHEPPVLSGMNNEWLTHDETQAGGLVFDHYAYATRKQVEFKEQYYGYAGAAKAWDKLQQNKHWPAKVAEFLPWVKDDAVAGVI